MPKLSVFDAEIGLRQQAATRYNELLNKAGVQSTPFVETYNVSAWAQYTVRVEQRDQVQAYLKSKDIPTAVHYPLPLNKQPAVADAMASVPVGDEVAQKVMSLPIGPHLTLEDQIYIVEHVKNAQIV